MENKILILTILSAIFLIGIVSAEGSFTFKQYENFTLEIAMGNLDLSPCTTCTCTISLFYPNGSAWIKDAVGTNSGDSYCHYSAKTGILGIYGGELVFTNDVDYGRSTFQFEITSTGKIPTSIFDNPIILILGLMGLCLIIFGATKGIPWFGFIGSIMFLLTGIYTMIYGFNNVSDMYTQGAALVFIGVGIIFMFLSTWEWIEDIGGEGEGVGIGDDE